MIKEMQAHVKLDLSKFSQASSIAVRDTEKEILALLLPLQAREQNQILRSIASQLEKGRAQAIDRRRRELKYLNQHSKLGRPFWRRIFQ